MSQTKVSRPLRYGHGGDKFLPKMYLKIQQKFCCILSYLFFSLRISITFWNTRLDEELKLESHTVLFGFRNKLCSFVMFSLSLFLVRTIQST